MSSKGGKCIIDTYINEMKSFPEKTYQKWKIKLNIDISKNDFLYQINKTERLSIQSSTLNISD